MSPWAKSPHLATVVGGCPRATGRVCLAVGTKPRPQERPGTVLDDDIRSSTYITIPFGKIKLISLLFARWLPRELRGGCRSYRDNREQAQMVTKSAGEIDATD
jgi:hypothetical protein